MADIKTGLIITGDASGGVKAVTATKTELAKLNKSQRDAANAAKYHASATSSLSTAIKFIGPAIAAAGIGAFIKGQIDAADKVQKLSIRLGASTEALSELQHVADLSGVSFDSLTMALQRQTRRVAEAAAGTGEAKKALQELGISAKQLNQLAPDKQFEVLADALSSVASEGDRVRLAMKVWDSEGVKMLQATQNGAQGIREMRDEAQRLGLSISQEFADEAAQFNDNMTRMQGAVTGLGNEITNTLITGFNSFVEEMEFKIIPAMKSFISELFGVEQEIQRLSTGEQIRKLKFEIEELEGRFARAQHSTERAQVALEKIRKTYGEASTAVLNYESKIDKALQTERGIIKVTQEKRAKLEELESQLKKNAPATTKLTGATENLGKTTKKTKDELGELLDKLFPAEKQTRELMHSVELLDAAFFSGKISADQYDAAIEALTTGTEDAAKATKKAAKEMADEADPFAVAWERAVERLDDAFLDIWKGGLNSFKNFGDSLKAAFNQLMAELAHAAITRPIVVGISGALGVGGGSAAQAAAGGIAQSGATNILGSFLPTGGLGGLVGSGLGALAGGIGGTFGAGLAASGASFGASGLLGGALGSMQAAGGFLAGGSGLAALGAALPVVLPLLGIAGLFGGLFGGKGDKTPDFELYQSLFNPDNGLQYDPGFRRFSESDIEFGLQTGFDSPVSGHTQHDMFGSQEEANAFVDSLQAQLLPEIAIADMLGTEVAGRVNGALANLSNAFDAEEPGDVEESLKQFFSRRYGAIFDAIGGQMDALFDSITAGGADAAEAAGAVASLFGTMDAFSNVFGDFDELVSRSSMTLYDSYQEQTRSLYGLIDAFDGSLEATNGLTTSLQAQYQATVSLLAQIESARSNISSTLGGTAERIMLDQMTPEQQYDYFRKQAEKLAGELSSMEDPAQIRATVAEIDRLVNSAYGVLGEDERKGMSPDILRFLTSVQGLANTQLTSAQGSVAADQQDILTLIGDKLDMDGLGVSSQAISDGGSAILTAAKSFESSANVISGAARAIAAAVGRTSGSDTVLA